MLEDKFSEVRIKNISAITPEGPRVIFEFSERLQYWKNYYKKQGIDWIELPEEISVCRQDAKKMKELIENFGFDYMIIIPQGLVSMTEDYYMDYERFIKQLFPHRQIERGMLELNEISDDRSELRIILTKKEQESNADVFKKIKKQIRLKY